MSFQHSNALESQPTTWRREDDPQYADDPEFKHLAESLSDQIFSLTSKCTQLSTEIAKLGTKRETERGRERVKSLISETGDSFKAIGEDLKKLTNWPDVGPAQRYTQKRLATEYQASLKEFQQLSKVAFEKEKASAAAARAALDEQRSPTQERSEFGGQQLQEQEQPRLASQDEVDFQEQMIIERESEIRNIEQSVGELNELFRDVAVMVREQGEQLDIIGEHVETTYDASRGAHQELTKANRYQKNARSKACILLLILAIVLVIIILAVVL